MRKYLILFLVLAAVSSLASCRRAARRAAEKIRVEQIERVDRHGLSGVDAVLRIANGTGYKLTLESAEFDLFYDGSRIGGLTLREAVEVPKRSTVSVETQWRLRISDPLALYVLARQLRQNDLSLIGVSFTVDGRGGPVPVHLSQQMVPLSQFLHTFGLTVDDLKKYLK